MSPEEKPARLEAIDKWFRTEPQTAEVFENAMWLLNELKASWEREEILEHRIKILYIDVSTIRRATDDLPKLKDVNRMVREALAKVKEMK